MLARTMATRASFLLPAGVRIASKPASAARGLATRYARPGTVTGSRMSNAETMGRSFVAASAAGGLGALMYYGSGMGAEAGIVDVAQFYPAYVKERLASTFTYFGLSLAATGVAAAATFKSGLVQRIAVMSPMMSLVVLTGGSLACMFASHSIPYENTVPKHLAWLGFTSFMGMSMAPIGMLGGPIVLKAALYTGITLASLCAVAATAPSDKFLYMGGALGAGLGIVFASSVAGMFLPVGSAVGSVLHSVSMYGGLVLFSGFVLYDGQKIVARAEAQHPDDVWDPINASTGIYMDSVNIFIRIAMILAGGNGRRK